MKIDRITNVLTPSEESHVSGVELMVELIINTKKTVQTNQNKC